MSDVIPVANPTLLRAQATAGQAGADAFKEASAILAEQQKSAAAMAMAEAQRRGAPAGAAMSVPNDLNTMYAQRIASMTDQAGVAQAQQESRVGRMADYNAAVNASRGLIADQTAQTVAPINAETDYRIKAITREGQNAVDKINAQMRLDAARAAYSAAGGGGGGRGGGGGGGGGSDKKDKLNETQLRAMLNDRGQAKMTQAIGRAQQAVRQTGEMQRQAASYAGRGAQEYAARQALNDRTRLSRQEAVRQAIAYAGRAGMDSARSVGRQVPTPAYLPSSTSIPTLVVPGVPNAAQDFPAQERLRLQRNEAMRQSGSYLSAAGGSRTPLIAQREAQRQAASYTGMAGGPRLPGAVDQQAVLRDVIGQQARAVAARRGGTMAAGSRAGRDAAPLLTDPTQNMLTEQQIRDLGASPDASLYNYLYGDTPIRRSADVEEALGGYSRSDGSVDPDAPDAMREAMILAALGLQGEGYEISEPQLRVALDDDGQYKLGSTFADTQGRKVGAGSVSEQQTAQTRATDAEYARMTADEKKAEDDRRAAFDALDDGFSQQFTQRTGLDASAYALPPDQLASIAADPGIAEAVAAYETKGLDRDELFRKLRQDLGYTSSDPYQKAAMEIIADMIGV